MKRDRGCIWITAACVLVSLLGLVGVVYAVVLRIWQDGSPGYSHSIKESESRGVFVREVPIRMDSILYGVVDIAIQEAWLERAWVKKAYWFGANEYVTLGGQSLIVCFSEEDMERMINRGFPAEWTIVCSSSVGQVEGRVLLPDRLLYHFGTMPGNVKFAISRSG